MRHPLPLQSGQEQSTSADGSVKGKKLGRKRVLISGPKNSLIKKNKQYNETDFVEERERIKTYFKNRGAYNFEVNNISYVVDTVNTNYKANVDLIISNETVSICYSPSGVATNVISNPKRFLNATAICTFVIQ